MFLVCLKGGLGNQMFQYAFGYSLSKKRQTTLKLDASSLEICSLRKYELGLYNIIENFASANEIQELRYKSEGLVERIFHKLRLKYTCFSKTYYKEADFYFDNKVFDVQENTYFDGYWQSEKYFLNFRNELLNIFNLNKIIHYQTDNLKNKINDIESVSLHIRRTDYIHNKMTNSILGTCSLDYYKNAVLKVKESIKNPHFFIFSDDLNWVKENINFIDNLTFVELNKNTPDHEEMFLMSKCKHNIIANSSFSWWGAWLNQYPEKIVIAPKKWFMDESIDTKDLIPKGWICL